MNTRRVKNAAALLRRIKLQKEAEAAFPGWTKLSALQKHAIAGLATGLMRGAKALGKGVSTAVGKYIGGPSAASIARSAAPGQMGAAMSAAKAAPMQALRQGVSNAGQAVRQGFNSDMNMVRNGVSALGQQAANARTAIGNAASSAGQAISNAPGAASKWIQRNPGSFVGGAGLLGGATGLGIGAANGAFGSFGVGPGAAMASPQNQGGASALQAPAEAPAPEAAPQAAPEMGMPQAPEPQLEGAAGAAGQPMPEMDIQPPAVAQPQAAQPDAAELMQQVPQPAAPAPQQGFQRQPVIGSGAPLQTMMGNIRDRRAAGMGIGQGNGPLRRAFGR